MANKNWYIAENTKIVHGLQKINYKRHEQIYLFKVSTVQILKSLLFYVANYDRSATYRHNKIV